MVICMPNYRAVRVAGLVKEEVARILREDIKDPRLGFITVTDAEVADDLKNVKIFVSILGDEKTIKDNMAILAKATSYFRGKIGRILQIRHTPDIVFKFDPSIQKGAHISKLLAEIETQDTGQDRETTD